MSITAVSLLCKSQLSLRAKAGYSLELPAHRRALTDGRGCHARCNLGFSILLTDTSTCSSAQPKLGFEQATFWSLANLHYSLSYSRRLYYYDLLLICHSTGLMLALYSKPKFSAKCSEFCLWFKSSKLQLPWQCLIGLCAGLWLAVKVFPDLFLYCVCVLLLALCFSPYSSHSGNCPISILFIIIIYYHHSLGLFSVIQPLLGHNNLGQRSLLLAT